MQATARVLTIPAAAPFIDTLAAALLDGRLVPGGRLDGDPLALAGATVFLPTRRAGRALAECLVDRLGRGSALLPSIRPLGAVDEDLLGLDAPEDDLAAAVGLDLAPAIEPMRRRLVFAELVSAWSRALSPGARARIADTAIAVPGSAADAVRLADDLVGLMDQVTREEARWEDLDRVVPEDLAGWWQITQTFLRIATALWPAVLADLGASDPEARRIALIDAEVRRLTIRPPPGPVIVAGSTGSVPATARLMAAVARLPQGAVVLPGLDGFADAASFALLDDPKAATDGVASHPQAGLARLLARLGIDRADVRPLAPPPSPALAARERLASEAFRPAATTDLWPGAAARIGDVAAALDGVVAITAASEREEALAIALALREGLSDPASRVALVTPDRAVARRVAAELARWEIAAEDSAGVPAAATPAGVVARLVAEVALAGTEAVAVLALLKHPDCDLALDPAARLAGTEALELTALRGPRLAPGFAAMARAAAGHEQAAAVVAALAAALAPLEALSRRRDAVPAATLAAAHRLALAHVLGPRRPIGLAAIEDDLDAVAAAGSPFAASAREWPSLFEALCGGDAVRPERDPDPRVLVLGPLEARLLDFDLVVLAGLADGTWPAVAETDGWVSRGMRAAIGLEPPERRIGLAAHDFCHGFARRRVVLSRARRVAGAPTVASRFLQRLAAVAGPEAWRRAEAAGDRLLDLARRLDRPAGPPQPAPRPAPRPPVALRPTTIRVTEVETLIRDPYAVYARRILRLDALEPIASDPGAGDRGQVLHHALALFLLRHGGAFDGGALDELLRAGEEAFEPLADRPEVTALWWPRFRRAAEAMVAILAGEPPPARRLIEVSGVLEIPAGGRVIRLEGRADRIDLGRDGIAIVDYKTGLPPSESQVRALLSPQLPLEAAIARGGGFAGIAPDTPVARLLYVSLRGRVPAAEVAEVASLTTDPTPEALAADAHARLATLLALYQSPDQPYLSRARIAFESDVSGAYDHLARVKEWAAAGERP